MKLLTIAGATALALSLVGAAPSEATAQPTVEISGIQQYDRKIKPSRASRTARRYLGVPYRYGGSSPRGFDCSGYTQYVYRKLGVKIPRRASLQRKALRRVSRPRIGDLVFFHNSNGSVYHVGIYAGKRTVWHSPYPGKRVKRERIWTRRVSYGRV